MYMTNFDHLSLIVGTYQPRGPRAALTSDIPTAQPRLLRLRRLHGYEVIRLGDVIEDVVSGERESVRRGLFYEAVSGYTVQAAMELPNVVGVLRPVPA